MKPRHRDRIWRIISNIKFGMLCYPEAHRYKSKPMTLVQDTLQDKLFFFANVEKEDYLKFKDSKKVLLNFSDPKTGQYVSINGEANLNRNEHLIKRFWNFSTSAWFPRGLDDPSLCLIEIDIVDGECWENPKGSFRTFFEILWAKVKGKQPDIGRKIVFY